MRCQLERRTSSVPRNRAYEEMRPYPVPPLSVRLEHSALVGDTATVSPEEGSGVMKSKTSIALTSNPALSTWVTTQERACETSARQLQEGPNGSCRDPCTRQTKQSDSSRKTSYAEDVPNEALKLQWAGPCNSERESAVVVRGIINPM
jgi:hypothetical protein